MQISSAEPFYRLKSVIGGFTERSGVGIRRSHGGRIAQLVEQLTLNQRVQGSSPCAPTIAVMDLTSSAQFGSVAGAENGLLASATNMMS